MIRSAPTHNSPLVGESRPAARRKSVDFPQPLGPIKETNSPGARNSVTLSNAGLGIPGLSGEGNSLRTFRMRKDEPSFSTLRFILSRSPPDCAFLPDENPVTH